MGRSSKVKVKWPCSPQKVEEVVDVVNGGEERELGLVALESLAGSDVTLLAMRLDAETF
jgi:hypothetical protein